MTVSRQVVADDWPSPVLTAPQPGLKEPLVMAGYPRTTSCPRSLGAMPAPQCLLASNAPGGFSTPICSKNSTSQENFPTHQRHDLRCCPPGRWSWSCFVDRIVDLEGRGLATSPLRLNHPRNSGSGRVSHVSCRGLRIINGGRGVPDRGSPAPRMVHNKVASRTRKRLGRGFSHR